MTGESAAPVTIEAMARNLAAGGQAVLARVEIREADFSVVRSDSAVWPGCATATEEQVPD